MRIGIDARMVNEGLGIGRYIARLLLHLENVDSNNTYIVFVTRKNWNAYQPKDSRFTKVCVDIHWYSIAEQCILPFILMWHRLDLIHFPHVNVPIVYPGRFIMTVHDLILIKHPLSATSAATTRHPGIHAAKHFCYRVILGIALRRAAHIITISESVKSDILNFFSLSETDISVTYEAADPLPAPDTCRTLDRFLKVKFFFRAGNAYPHKNLEGLLSAFKRARAAQPDTYLLLCGQEDFFQRRIIDRIAEAGLSDSVIHLGSVSDSCLSWLYAHAFAYVFPSFEEGFGLPAVEAFLHGCPVLASDIPVLKEVCGPAALYFDPNNVNDIARAMVTILTQQERRLFLISKGEKRAKMFSWDRLAKETELVYTRYGL
ncbi:MAG: glycosyltransferase family 1 protein [Candidatus Uhrbacteria bacterium]|nr:glycosyltransferase family 1 protein [Candidatus Uhrbacteria bacterium]